MQLLPWKLEADDTKLLDLLPFLEAVVRTAVPDVRAVVRSYEGQDIPTAFKCGMTSQLYSTSARMSSSATCPVQPVLRAFTKINTSLRPYKGACTPC